MQFNNPYHAHPMAYTEERVLSPQLPTQGFFQMPRQEVLLWKFIYQPGLKTDAALRTHLNKWNTKIKRILLWPSSPTSDQLENIFSVETPFKTNLLHLRMTTVLSTQWDGSFPWTSKEPKSRIIESQNVLDWEGLTRIIEPSSWLCTSFSIVCRFN